MSQARLYRVILPTPDIGKTSKFFQRVFDTDGERVSSGRHYFDCGGVILAVYDPSADGDEEMPGWQFHESQYLYFSVADLNGVKERVESANGKLLTDIAAMPWGETLFYALEPCGGRLCFVDEKTLFTG